VKTGDRDEALLSNLNLPSLSLGQTQQGQGEGDALPKRRSAWRHGKGNRLPLLRPSERQVRQGRRPSRPSRPSRKM
jgi:hypothetical protein